MHGSYENYSTFLRESPLWSECINDLLSKMIASIIRNGINTRTLKSISNIESLFQPGTPFIPAAPATDGNPTAPEIPAKAAISAVHVMVSSRELLHRNGTGKNGTHMKSAQSHMKIFLKKLITSTHLQ